MIKMKDFYILCKWENLQCIKYLFSPLYTEILSIFYVTFIFVLS